jgi:hypothetical protein
MLQIARSVAFGTFDKGSESVERSLQLVGRGGSGSR